jgi:hypothetical protein
MKKFRLNSIPKVIKENQELIFPEVGARVAEDHIRSVSFTADTLNKLNRMRAKYRLSRSALIRILIDKAPL